MAINRDKLIAGILSAYEKNDLDTYKELLGIFYKLLVQEDINDIYLNEFTSYDSISDEAMQILSMAN